LKEPVESLVQKLENTEQKHLNEIQSMKRKYENTSEEKEKEIKKIKKANQNLKFKVQKQSNTIKQLRYHSKMLKLQKSRQASYVLKFKSNIRQVFHLNVFVQCFLISGPNFLLVLSMPVELV
jgi:rubrerythrin